MSKRKLPPELAMTFPAAIAQMKEIADQATDALLTEGPVHPDHQLLDLCAAALHHLAKATKAWNARSDVDWYGQSTKEAREAAYALDQQFYAEFLERERVGKPYLARITKLKAHTPAGIYAKAMVVRASKTGAAGLAMTLAEDLLACETLRQSLWPAREGA